MRKGSAIKIPLPAGGGHPRIHYREDSSTACSCSSRFDARSVPQLELLIQIIRFNLILYKALKPNMIGFASIIPKRERQKILFRYLKQDKIDLYRIGIKFKLKTRKAWRHSAAKLFFINATKIYRLDAIFLDMGIKRKISVHF
jgi:hypothetical protein